VGYEFRGSVSGGLLDDLVCDFRMTLKLRVSVRRQPARHRLLRELFPRLGVRGYPKRNNALINFPHTSKRTLEMAADMSDRVKASGGGFRLGF